MDEPHERRAVGWWIPIVSVTMVGAAGRIFIYPIYQEDPTRGILWAVGVIAAHVIVTCSIMYALNRERTPKS